MNYRLTCVSCGKKVKVSTKDSIKYEEDGKIMVSFDCPKCKCEIIAERLHR